MLNIVCCCIAAAQTKQYSFKHYTAETGLTSSGVNAFCQDKQGYLWIGGINGLQRYDGYRFKNFFAELRNPKALHSNIVSAIFEDSKGRLWVGTTRDGAYILNRNDFSFYSYNSQIQDAARKIQGVVCFAEDGNKDIWFTNATGFYKLNVVTNQFENQSSQLGFDIKDLASTAISDASGNLWLCGTKTFKYYNVKSKTLYHKQHNPLGLKIFDINESPARIDCDVNGNLWFATPRNKVYCFNEKENSLTYFDYKKILTQNGYPNLVSYKFDYAVNIFCDKKNVVMGFPEKGLAFYDYNTNLFNFIPNNLNDYFGLHNFGNNGTVAGILTDKDGIIWVYGGNGLEYFNPKRQSFRPVLSTNISRGKTLPNLEISDIIQSRFTHDIYVSYYDYKINGGIYRLDSNLNVKQQYMLKPGQESAKNQVWCLFEDNDGNIWAPNQDRTLLKLNTKTNQLAEVNDSSLFGYINTIVGDKNGDMWLGYWNKGLKKVDFNTKKTIAYNIRPKGFPAPVNRVYGICFDGDSLLWLATENCGLVSFDKRTNAFLKSYTYNEKNMYSISSNLVKNVYVLNPDTLLVTTAEGLNIFDKHSKRFTVITNKQGLTSNFVESVFFDDDKNIWVCCANGICKINPRSWKITSYSSQDGMIERGITGRIEKLGNGDILIGTAAGIMMFNPKEINAAKIPADVQISGLQVFNQPKYIDSVIILQKPVELKYNENAITIEFASTDYYYQNKVNYYYQLEGIDKDWVISGKEAAAHYGNLDNGRYLFKVKCVDNNGVACKNITQFCLVIHPPFYKKWWFVLCEIFLLGLICIYFFQWRSNNKKRIALIAEEQEHIKQLEKEQKLIKVQAEQEFNKKIAEVRLQALRSQMNPHFIFNSLNSINHFILLNDTDNASNYLTKFSRLIRLILDSSRTEWSSLETEIKALELYIELEMVRFDNAFEYNIYIDEELNPATVVVPPLIIQPYIENAIWHGLLHKQNGKGKLQIRIRDLNDELQISIEDNGVGREKANEIKSSKTLLHKSHGMKITAERLAIVNNVYDVNAAVNITDVRDADGMARGTIVLITMKKNTNASSNH